MDNLILVINKEKDYTSRDVVNKLSKIIGTKKVGHTGTLDPIATGVLVCLSGKYTKLVELLTSEEKEYVATIRLGISTDSLDITGNVLKEDYNYNLKEKDILNSLNKFVGEYNQTVPVYSAVHVNGKRLYEYARENKEVELPIRKVCVKEIELIEYNGELIKFRVVVSKGTYIRSLIQDICNDLNVLGTMDSLIRTRQGMFKLEDSVSLDDIEKGNLKYIKLEDVFELTKVDLNDNMYKKVINGNKLELDYNGFVLFQKDSNDIALYYFENNIGRLKILF